MSNNFLIVLEVEDGVFIPVQNDIQARGFRPVEVWIFGHALTPAQRKTMESAKVGFAHLPQSKIHYMYLER